MAILFIIILLIFCALLAPLIYVFHRQKFSSLARHVNVIPGPTGHPFFGNILQFSGPRIGRFERVYDLLKPYLDIGLARFWAGPEPFLLIFSAENVEALLTSHKHLEKADIYRFLHPWLGLGLLTSTGTRWSARRKLLTPAFHFNILEDFIPIMNEQSIILVKKLESEVNKPKLNMFNYITLCALDIICASAMGCEVHNQLNKDSEYVQAIHRVSDTLFTRMSYPWLHPDFIFALTKHGRSFKKHLKVLHYFTRKVIQEKKSSKVSQISSDNNITGGNSCYTKRKRLAFLDLLLQCSENGALLTDKDIQEEVDTFMFEGHDTTSSAIFWVLHNIGLHSGIQDKLYEEIESIVGNDESVTSEHIKKMKYLECVCKESLRLNPSVPIISRKITEPFKMGRFTVPAGVSCSINTFYLHRDPDHFPNPEKFDPDRFLAENTRNRHPFAYVPFSAGPRNCIGMKFAMMEEKVVLTHIIRRFKVTTVYRGDKNLALNELVLRPSQELTTLLEFRE